MFGKYGALRQIRIGNTPETKGSAFVVYEDIYDAKNACEHLSGFNVGGRYLLVLYFRTNRARGTNLVTQQAEVDALKARVAAGEAVVAAAAAGGANNDDDDDEGELDDDRGMVRLDRR